MSSRGGEFLLGNKMHFLRKRGKLQKSREYVNSGDIWHDSMCEYACFEYHSFFLCPTFVLVWMFVCVC